MEEMPRQRGNSFPIAFPLVPRLFCGPLFFFFFLSRVMAAPKTQGAATQGEDSDGNRGGAGGVSYEGEYGASEVQMVFCLRFFPTWNTADCWTDLSSVQPLEREGATGGAPRDRRG